MNRGRAGHACKTHTQHKPTTPSSSRSSLSPPHPFPPPSQSVYLPLAHGSLAVDGGRKEARVVVVVGGGGECEVGWGWLGYGVLHRRPSRGGRRLGGKKKAWEAIHSPHRTPPRSLRPKHRRPGHPHDRREESRQRRRAPCWASLPEEGASPSPPPAGWLPVIRKAVPKHSIFSEQRKEAWGPGRRHHAP